MNKQTQQLLKRGLSRLEKSAVEVREPGHKLTRPVSSTIGRLGGAIGLGIAAHRPDLAFRKWTPARIEKAKAVAKKMQDTYDLNEDTLISLGKYRPLTQLKRIWTNKDNSLFGKLFGSALTPVHAAAGALFRGDQYNPWSNTAVNYNPHPALAAHELGHSADFQTARFKTPYFMAGYGLPQVGRIPFAALYPEARASNAAMSAISDKDWEELSEEEKKESEELMRRAYGSYLGTTPSPQLNQALQIGGPIATRFSGAPKFKKSKEYAKKLRDAIQKRNKSVEESGPIMRALGLGALYSNKEKDEDE